ncbi:MAG: hypothetical protein LC630_02165 [Bacteroidales bacterium]|nr:hypothetical protein [Bacteroidales bacterium]
MTDETTQRKVAIVDTLRNKSVLKQQVFDNTATAFMMVKEILKNLSKEVNGNLTGVDPRVRMEYTDRSSFDASACTPTFSSLTASIRHGRRPTSRRASSTHTAA